MTSGFNILFLPRKLFRYSTNDTPGAREKERERERGRRGSESPRSRAESDGVVGLVADRAGEESGAARLVVRVCVRAGAVGLEVGVVVHAGRRARCGRVVRARAAVVVVGCGEKARQTSRARCQIGAQVQLTDGTTEASKAGGFAADGEAGLVEGALEGSRACDRRRDKFSYPSRKPP